MPRTQSRSALGWSWLRGYGPRAVLAAVVVMLIAVLMACTPTQSPQAPGSNGAGTQAAGPSAGGTQGTEATVQQVFDGDTIQVRMAGKLTKVRMLGIDAPEIGSCGDQDAVDRLRQVLKKGTQVQIISDSRADSHDRFGRTLGYVELNGVDINAQQVAEGMAGVWWPSGEPKPDRASGYQRLEDTAKANKTGSWQKCERLGR